MPAGSSPGRATTRPRTSAVQQQGRSEQPGAGDQPPVVRTGERPDDVRDDEPDEGDRSAGGRRGPAQQGDDGEPDGARRPDPATQPTGDVLPEGEQVQGRGVGHGEDHADGDERSHLRRDVGASSGQPADDREAEGVQRLLVATSTARTAA